MTSSTQIRAAGAEPMTKGSVLREFARWCADRYGDALVTEMLAEIPEHLRPPVDRDDPAASLLAATWYPSRVAHSLLDSFASRHEASEIDRLMQEAARSIVKQSTTGVYRFFLVKLVTPELYALSIPRVWTQIHTTGTRRLDIVGPNEAKSIISDWRGHHPLLCTISNATMGALFEEMGKRDVRWERTECVSQRGRVCATTLRWK